MSRKIGFVGCGNMGSALIEGIILSKIVIPTDIFVFDKNANKINRLIEKYRIQQKSSINEVFDEVDIMILAVKPNSIDEVLNEIEIDNSTRKIIISLAAGITIDSINRIIRNKAKVVRVMPNAPALVGEGVSAICYDEPIEEQDKEYIKKLFTSVGNIIEIDEKHINAFTAISGSSPAYVLMMIEAMADAAVRMGLRRDAAHEIVSQVILGTAKMIIDTKKHPAELKDTICSPSGTTIEGLFVLEQKGFRGIIMEALDKCYNKAEKMSKGN